MTREEFYKLTDILNSDVLGNFMHGGEADELIAMFEEAVEHSNILEQEEPVRKQSVEESIAEVEEKAKTFTETHKGESAEEILAEMRGEKPVSDDLGEYINELSKQFPEVSFAKLSRIAVRVAKWQKDQFEKNRLAACDRQTEEEADIERDWDALRNQAAIAAMQGIISNTELMKVIAKEVNNSEAARYNVVHNAIMYADALIEQLKK